MIQPADAPLPEDFLYHADFISIDEEQALLCRMEGLVFEEVKMHGVVAKRKTLHFGWRYGYESWKITPGQAVPDWLFHLRERVSGLMQEPAANIEEVLLSQYHPEPASDGTATRRCLAQRSLDSHLGESAGFAFNAGEG